MRERAIIVDELGDNAKVEIMRTSACAKCRSCSLGASDKRKLHIIAKNPLQAKKGQIVEVELKKDAFFKATIYAFLIPLFAFILGVFVGYKWSLPLIVVNNQEVRALTTGLLAMGISFLLNYLQNRKFEESEKFTSSIVNIL